MENELLTLEEKLRQHDIILTRHELSLYGDNSRGQDGVVLTVRRQQDTLDELRSMVRDMHTRWQTLVTMGKVVIAILSLTGIGVWISLFEAIQHGATIP